MVDEKREKTAEDLVLEAIKILQRGLPGRDLDDRGVVSELWGVLDSKGAREIYHRIERSRTSKG
nr:hypothetical protein [uncultured Devosia sp.]